MRESTRKAIDTVMAETGLAEKAIKVTFIKNAVRLDWPVKNEDGSLGLAHRTFKHASATASAPAAVTTEATTPAPTV